MNLTTIIINMIREEERRMRGRFGCGVDLSSYNCGKEGRKGAWAGWCGVVEMGYELDLNNLVL